ncbi:DDB1- and CUL4-associated factor 4 [Lampetra fluviatilis]
MSGRWRGGRKRGHWVAPEPGHRRMRHRHRPSEAHGEGTSSAAAVSQLAQTGDTSDAPELPGFYFDREKNRYFRLLPGHNNCNPLTTESICAREKERQRLQLLKQDESTNRVPQNGVPVTRVLNERRAGFHSTRSYSRLMHELKLVAMQRRVVHSVSGDFGLLELDSKSERIFALYNEHTHYKYGLFDLSCREGKLHTKIYGLLKASPCKLNSMSWASFNGKDSHILYPLPIITKIARNEVAVSDGAMHASVELVPVSYFTGEGTGVDAIFNFTILTFSCVYGRHPQHNHCFSAGCSGKAVVTDVVTGHQQTIHTHSDVLAQCFAEQSPLLYCGCRSGKVWRADLRDGTGPNGSRRRRSLLRHESAIVALRTLADENYLLASDMAGKIKLWDVRTQRSVLEYHGHHNEHAILPLHVSDDENFIVAVGQDNSTRFWRLRDGLLLRTMPSAVPVSCTKAAPSVALMPSLGGPHGAPGLLVAAGQRLFHYSY